MTKQNYKKDFQVVVRAAVTETFRNIKPGTDITFDCRDFAPMGSAKSAVSRLNEDGRYDEYRRDRLAEQLAGKFVVTKTKTKTKTT